MDVETPDRKRRLVSFDNRGVEIQETKRQRIVLDEQQRLLVLKVISASYLWIVSNFRLTGNNLHTSAQIANIMLTTFRRMKQELSKKGRLSEHDAKDFTVMENGVSHTVKRDEVRTIMKEVIGFYGLPMTMPKNDEKGHWWGTFMPYMVYCCGWKHRLNELRVGHSTFPVAKVNGKKDECKTSEFGLSSKYHIFCEGLSFPPEVRSSMAQSVGAVTSIVSLIKENKGSEYIKKHRDAVARAFAHLNNRLDPVLDALEGSTAASSAPLVLALAKLSLVVPPRTQRRAYFPLCVVAHLCMTVEEAQHYTVEWGSKSADEKEVMEIKSKPKEVFKDKDGKFPLTEALIAWSHSGKAAFLNYNEATEMVLLFPKVAKSDPIAAAQAVFHAIWGTYCEDLSLLSWMTEEKNWLRRHEMHGFMDNFGQCKETIKIKLPKYIYYSKLASANVTPFLTETSQQISSNPIFAGTARRHFSQDLYETLDDSSAPQSLRGKNIPSMALEICNLARSIGDQIRLDNNMEYGTVPFKCVVDATRAKGVDGSDAFSPRLTGEYFLCRRGD